MKTKPKIEFHSSGESGNIHWVLAKLRDALRKQRRIIDYNEAWERVQKSGSYTEALAIIREYADLTDLDGRL